MFSNIGERLKTVAKVFMVVGIVFAVIYGAAIMAGMPLGEGMENIGKGSNIISGVLTIIIGSLISWISSWFIYALGQLVTDVKKLVDEK